MKHLADAALVNVEKLDVDVEEGSAKLVVVPLSLLKLVGQVRHTQHEEERREAPVAMGYSHPKIDASAGEDERRNDVVLVCAEELAHGADGLAL